MNGVLEVALLEAAEYDRVRSRPHVCWANSWEPGATATCFHREVSPLGLCEGHRQALRESSPA